ncbi:MAG: YihY/virulence factor BrkB family protein [Acidimicrobiaceae bacterium]|nr:YihY/virulence factor BrkB family protein [Acidimicrobiaceae bacterium]
MSNDRSFKTRWQDSVRKLAQKKLGHSQKLTRTRWLAEEFNKSWSDKRVGGLSAEIAFFTVLGLFPLTIVFVSFLGFFDSVIGQDTTSTIKTWITDQISNVFGSDNSLGEIVVDLFNRSGAASITLGIVISLYAASRGFGAVVRALCVVYNIEKRHNWLFARLLGFVVMIVTLLVSILLGAMAVVGPLIVDNWLSHFGANRLFAFAWYWARWPLVVCVTVLWMASFYCFVPKHKVAWRYHLFGAFLGTFWWLTVSAGFRVYLEFASGGINVVLGILGSALSLLLWLYLLAMGFLTGAVLNSSLISYRHEFHNSSPRIS